MIDSVLNTAASGLRTYASDAARAADRLVNATARPETTEADIVNSVVELKQAEIGFSASATVFRTGDELTGTLIDIFA